MDLNVATWNLDGWAPLRAADKARLVSDHGVDVLCAQELPASRYRQMLEELGDSWWGVHSLNVPADAPNPRSHWGVAVFGRTAVGQPQDGGAQVIGPVADDSGKGLFWRRTVCVPIETTSGTVNVMSVHVRPGAVVRRLKLEFLENLLTWIGGFDRPLILGVDANSPGNDQGEEHYWTPDEGLGERDLWSSQPKHQLKDAWHSNPCLPAYTHKLKRRSAHAEVRFDHILVSQQVRVTALQHLYDEAREAGSDHALVIARLSV